MPRITVTIHYEKHKPVLHSDPNAEAILVQHVLVDGHRVLFHQKHGEDRWDVLETTENRLRLALAPQVCFFCGNKPKRPGPMMACRGCGRDVELTEAIVGLCRDCAKDKIERGI